MKNQALDGGTTPATEPHTIKLDPEALVEQIKSFRLQMEAVTPLTPA